jgi:phosphate/sulfate permease
MKMRITMAAVIGATVGAGWVMALGAGHSTDSSLASAWNAIMWASCPAIGAIRAAWWLVPLLNGILYGVIALFVLFVRKFIRPFAK